MILSATKSKCRSLRFAHFVRFGRDDKVYVDLLPLRRRSGFGWYGLGLRGEEGQFLDEIDSGAAENLVYGLLVEAGGVVLDANGADLGVKLDAADAVNFTSLAEREHGGFGRMMLVAVENFQQRHRLMIAAGDGALMSKQMRYDVPATLTIGNSHEFRLRFCEKSQVGLVWMAAHLRFQINGWLMRTRSTFENWFRSRARKTIDGWFCSSSPEIRLIGDESTGWVINTNPLPKVSYCAGVGKGMSFEIELARISDGCVLVFDPSPTGVVTAQCSDASKITFYPVGLAAERMTYEFSLPERASEGSYSVARDGQEKTAFECWSLEFIMQKHGHASIDLLKMDIEGFEYDVIDRIIEKGIPIRQICVEFHPWLKPKRTFRTIRKLHHAGYRIVHKHRGDHTFLRRPD